MSPWPVLGLQGEGGGVTQLALILRKVTPGAVGMGREGGDRDVSGARGWAILPGAEGPWQGADPGRPTY